MVLELSVVGEGVEAASSVDGAADDDVVEEVDLHFAGRFGEAFGEVEVGSAGGGAAGGVVVRQDEVAGLVDEDGAKDFADGGEGLIGSSAGDVVLADKTGGGIETEDDEFLGGLQGKLGREELVNGFAVGELEVFAAIAGGPGAEFEGGLNLAGFGEAEPVFLAEFFEIELGQGDDASVFADELAPDFDGAGSAGSGAQEDGKEFLVGEGGGSQGGHFFTRLLIAGKIVDSGAVGHLQRSIEISRKSSKLSVMNDKVIVFFDSDCLMCQGALKWLHRLDADDRLLFAPLSGETAKERGITMEDDSMAVVKNGEIHRASEAARLALAGTGGVAGILAAIIRLIPLPLRDRIYREIARRRKSLMKSGACSIPEAGMAAKVLD